MNMVALARPGAPVHSRPSDSPPPDFTTIDSAQKAAWLPSLRTPEMVVTFNALQQARQNGMGFAAALHATLGGQTSYGLQYQMANPASGSVSVSGQLGTAAVQETWTLGDDGSVHIDGQVGTSAEHLGYVPGPDGTHVDGTVGTVDVHELFQNQYTPYGPCLEGSGTVGGQTFQEADANNQTTMVSQGSVGGAPTNIRDTTTQADRWHETLIADGEVAGAAYISRQDVALTWPT